MSTETPSRSAHPLVIAVDGPAGSGKSSVSRGVAAHLGYDYLDTGAMYRAAALAVLEGEADDPTLILTDVQIASGTDPDSPTISLNGRDVSTQIRTPEVTDLVSEVSAVPEVRTRMVELQRAAVNHAQATGRGIVVEGRDIGTVVLPDADLKIFLVADPAVRAARRAAEHRSLGHDADEHDTKSKLLRRDEADSSRPVSPLTQAADAVVIDATHLDLDQVIHQVLENVRRVQSNAAVSIHGREGDADDSEFDDAEFDEDDLDDGEFGASELGADELAALEAEVLAEFADDEELRADRAVLPTVAVVGRPNVGKSTLVNRILGRREAVVEDTPGVTRDRVAYEADWDGHDFILWDTGGWEDRVTGLSAAVAAQAERAMREADVVLFVVDATVGATDVDEAVVRVLRRADKPVILAANKADGPSADSDVAALWNLGIGEPHPVSALHGRGSGDLLQAVVEVLPPEGTGSALPHGPNRIALLGRPNVGKSSLLNKLAGEDRVVVDSVAGTTVDPVDELVELGGEEWLFVDTAGLRRKVRQASGHEYFASIRTQAALDRAECALILFDASEPLSEQDIRIVTMAAESGRAMVLAFNKWDLVDEERRHQLDREYDRELHQVQWAPRVNVSARTGRHVEKLVPAMDVALDGWSTRVPTGKLNQFFSEIVAAHPHPIRGGKQPRILFGTQARTAPPTFVLFTTGFLEAGYRRFLERRLREEFGFEGSPIRINVRVREKRRRRGR